MPAPRRTAAVLTTALLLAGAGACSDDGGDSVGDSVEASATTTAGIATTEGSTATTSGLGGDDLPPAADAELADLYAPVLEPLGLEFTRGSLILSADGTTHLALYVVPTGESGGPQGYLDRVLPLVAALDPLLFDEFDDLDSFDVCQEPVPADGEREEFPPPQTLLLMDREPFQSVEDWSTASLADLMVAVDSDPQAQFDVLPEIELLADWQAAEADAGRT